VPDFGEAVREAVDRRLQASPGTDAKDTVRQLAAALDEEAQAQPNALAPLIHLAYLYAIPRSWSKVVAILERAQARAQDDSLVALWLAQARYNAGDLDGAIAGARAVLAGPSPRQLADELLVLALWQAARTEEARQALSAAFEQELESALSTRMNRYRDLLVAEAK
jgi:tetratricopeptide (TPR) repeat protein